MKRWLLMLLLLGAADASSSPSTLMANIPDRTTVSPNGAWRSLGISSLGFR
jgi:hypothetical protein